MRYHCSLPSVLVRFRQFGPVSEYMINTYCASLKEGFAELVHFGLLNEGDGQCFRVNSHIEGGSFVLLVGAVALAVFNSIVSKAVEQYFGDKRSHMAAKQNLKSDNDDSDNVEIEAIETEATRTNIKPANVLFTDMYGWILCKEIETTNSHNDELTH